MKAVVCTKYGSPDFLKYTDLVKPVPKDNEVLVKVLASAVTAADTMMRKADPFVSRLFLGFFKPKAGVTGTGFSGIVEAVGKNVSDFRPGDPVFGESGLNFGANAEFVCVNAQGVIAHKPVTLSFEEAATVCDGFLTSFNFLKEIGNIQPGQSVLIIGASGSLGTAAVQLSRYFGALVTGVCSSKNHQLVKSLGADKVIDYTKTDYTKTDDRYDLIFDTVGKSSFLRCRKVLQPSGVYLCPVLKTSLLAQIVWTKIRRGKTAVFSATGLLPAPKLLAMIDQLMKLFVRNKLKSVIDRRYSLRDAKDAHRYVDSGRKKGNIVLIPETSSLVSLG